MAIRCGLGRAVRGTKTRCIRTRSAKERSGGRSLRLGRREGPVRIVKRIDYRYGTYFLVEPAEPAAHKVWRARHRICFNTLCTSYVPVRAPRILKDLSA